MKRTAAVLVTTIVGITTLSGCGGGGDPYCDAVEKNKASLETFGEPKTDAGFAKSARILNDLAKVAPKKVRKDWRALGEGTEGVIKAQKAVGIPLEDVTKASVAKLSTAQQAALNESYKSFNSAVRAHGLAVTTNIKQECKIKLK